MMLRPFEFIMAECEMDAFLERSSQFPMHKFWCYFSWLKTFNMFCIRSKFEREVNLNKYSENRFQCITSSWSLHFQVFFFSLLRIDSSQEHVGLEAQSSYMLQRGFSTILRRHLYALCDLIIRQICSIISQWCYIPCLIHMHDDINELLMGSDMFILS